MKLLNDALEYYERGWNVIPVNPKKKNPVLPWAEYHKKRVNSNDIRQWWKDYPDANIGIVTGAVSNLVVVDIDDVNSIPKLEKIVGSRIETLMSATGGGGIHMFFQHPGTLVPNMVNFIPGVDIRADGGLVVVPPSLHSSGNYYKWTNKEKTAPLPIELYNLIVKGRSSNLKLDDWESTISKGSRDNELTRRVGKLLSINISPKETLSMIRQWNLDHCNPPLPDFQVKKVVESIAKRELLQRKMQGNNVIKEENKNSFNNEKFRIIPFNDTLNEFGFREEKWLVQDWLPDATIGMVIAPPGSYKTWLLLALALSISTGQKFLGKFPVFETGPVIFIQQEDSFPTLFNRLGAIIGIGRPEVNGKIHTVPLPPEMPPIYWHPDHKFNFKDKEVINSLYSAIKKIQAKLVVIDPLYSATETKDYMAESAQHMLILKEIRDKTGCSFVIAHHTKKNVEADAGRERAWGSQFLNAWLETGWQIRKIDDSTISVLRHFKHRTSLERLKVSFDIDNWRFHSDIETESSNVKIEIESLVKKKNVKSQRQIMKQLNMNGLGTINKIFKELGIEKNKNGIYLLPDEEEG